MKRFYALGIAIALPFFVSCGKQQTEAEKNAEIESQVQQRLAAEHQADEQQKLAQREAELKAREDALAQREQETAPTPTATPQMRGGEIQQRDVTETEQIPEAAGDETASYDTFYTKLEPYGAWHETTDYGYVWQPNELGRSRNWRPYTNGRWVYTDAGWTWYSEEPFGWATYHYGRWTRLRGIGWVWIPGDQWAPAWVSWRTSNDYVGWAPLPPEARFDRSRGIHNWADNYYDIGPDQYCFVAANDFGAQRVERTIVPVERNVTIINQTINVTNITYSKTTIVNQGPDYDELRKHSREPIQRLRLDRRQRFENANPHAVVRGDVIEMPAPAIAPARPADRPRALKEKIGRTTVDRGWSDIQDKKAAENARAKMKAEATPPPDAPPTKIIEAQPHQTLEPAQPAQTPVRNFPDRAKMKLRPSPTMTTGVVATPSPTASLPRVEARDAERQMKEAQRNAKPVKNQSPSPAASISQRATPSPTATVAEPSPTPIMTTPYAQEREVQTPPPIARKRIITPTSQPRLNLPPSSNASPADRAGSRETKSGEKEKGRNKRDHKGPAPSPTATP